jgi:hypothetical protein
MTSKKSPLALAISTWRVCMFLTRSSLELRGCLPRINLYNCRITLPCVMHQTLTTLRGTGGSRASALLGPSTSGSWACGVCVGAKLRKSVCITSWMLRRSSGTVFTCKAPAELELVASLVRPLSAPEKRDNSGIASTMTCSSGNLSRTALANKAAVCEVRWYGLVKIFLGIP